MIIVSQHSDYFQWEGKGPSLEGDTVVFAILIRFCFLNWKVSEKCLISFSAYTLYFTFLKKCEGIGRIDTTPYRWTWLQKNSYADWFITMNLKGRFRPPGNHISLFHLSMCSPRIIYYTFSSLSLQHLLPILSFGCWFRFLLHWEPWSKECFHILTTINTARILCPHILLYLSLALHVPI